ncbi:MAG: bifunctional 4-hydroxy-2-oxoglutarate aldolase/2-dehydro-3-deoxy-phosphogluconate aldolase [Oscillospiraceae bacterium]|jgi:2-dehydro-3-deoxyphosphogluconate aldolase/(4S)-4-hydroxy-2-oxoglutarate aldolase|nr:bifunctional 4-hydroxy-2-oxoglutarate aldolase/2-dehydro-3-deoxy-phosphogluconate aldolase [Oscillospiraceae bacterium]
MDMLDRLSLAGIVPVIKIEDAADAVPLCRALAEGGLPVAEITFRTAAAPDAIAAVHRELPDVLLGAGTVLTAEQVDKAKAAGAGYVVTPGINPQVVARCQQVGLPVVPGCANPSDIEVAIGFGLKVVKFFPAEAIGGLPLIKALAGPYGDMRFVPTGGIGEKNLLDYLSFPKVAACGGSWMVPDAAIKAKDWDKIRDLTASAVQLMLGFELAHVGVNSQSEGEAKNTADTFGKLLNWPVKEGNGSLFAGAGLEIMKAQGRGSRGHLAIRTNSVARAKAWLQGRSVAFAEETAGYKDGKLIFIYLRDEIGGFAVHLAQK